MKTRSELAKEFYETQSIYDKLLLDIGLLSARNQLANDSTIEMKLSTKINAFHQIELQLLDIEKEIAKLKE